MHAYKYISIRLYTNGPGSVYILNYRYTYIYVRNIEYRSTRSNIYISRDRAYELYVPYLGEPSKYNHS